MSLWHLPWLLPRLLGRARALGLAMTGDKLPAEEARNYAPTVVLLDDDNLIKKAA